MNKEQKQDISFEVIKVLKSRFDSFPNDETISRNAPFHKAFLQAFSNKFFDLNLDVDVSMAISSWIHGLNTTLGQSFFEKVAQILSCGQKRTFKENYIYQNQSNIISEIMTDLKNNQHVPSVTRENSLINSNANGEQTFAPNFTADCFVEDTDKIIAIELKSVRPNSGEIRGEKQKVLLAKAALKQKFPNKQIFYYFGFPFDPLSNTETGYNKKLFMDSVIEFSKFCAEEEVLIASELWDFLSGQQHTMDDILQIIKKISTINFSENFDFLSSNDYFNNIEKYKNIVSSWDIYNEIEIINNFNNLLTLSSTNKIVCRNIHLSPFNQDGTYNIRRYNNLKSFIVS